MGCRDFARFERGKWTQMCLHVRRRAHRLVSRLVISVVVRLTFSLRTLFLPGKRWSASIQDGARDASWPPTTLLGSTQGAHAALANRVLAEAQNGPLCLRDPCYFLLSVVWNGLCHRHALASLPVSKAIRCAGETKGGDRCRRLVGPPQLRCYLHQAGEAAEGGSARDRLPSSFAHLGTRQVSRLAGLTDAYRLLGKTFRPGSVFSARLEEHNRVLGKTFAGFGPKSVLASRLEEHNRVLGKTFAGFGPKSVLAGRLEEHSRLLGKTFGPGSVFSARLEEHSRLLGKTFGPGSVFSAPLEEHNRVLGMIGDLAQAVAFEDIAVAESLDASADLAGVDSTKIRPELLSAALAALWLTWLIAAWLDYASTYGVDLEWANRFALIDDFGLVFGSTIAVYCNSLRLFKRLSR
jgi:hypothetical protein